MKKIVRLTESELTDIIKEIIYEQNYVDKSSYPTSDYLGKGGQFERQNRYYNPHYTCVPENFREAVYFAINDKKLNKTFVKYALGIIGRESSYGRTTKDGSSIIPSKYAIKSPFEYVYNSMDNKNPLKQIINWAATKIKGESGGKWVPSMGLAQMTPIIAKKYNVNIEQLMSPIGSLVAATQYVMDNYKILTNYYSDSVPSVINKDGKFIENPNSTGNARLDAAIASYNVGPKKYSKKFCTTNNPKILGPCNETTYKPYEKQNMVLTVNQKNPIQNYFPFYKDGQLTNWGYLKEVKENAEKFTCI